MADTKMYLRTRVNRRWQQIVRVADELLALSPYLTNCEITAALAAQGADCTLYTVASVENFASGASSLACLRTLMASGVRVYHLPGLHAKMLLVPDKVVTVGSQNFTAGGCINLEATVALKGARIARQALTEVQGWIDAVNPVRVTNEILAVLEAEVERLRPEYQQLHGDAQEATDQMWEQERNRQEEERREQERREQERQRLEAAQREVEERRLEDQQRREAFERQMVEQLRQRQTSNPSQERRSSQDVREAGIVHAGTVVDTAHGWSLVADTDNDLLRWEPPGRPLERLIKGFWYPCHLSEHCRWGWVRLYPSCITFVARCRQHGSHFYVGSRRYLITPSFVWDSPAVGSNISFTIWWSGNQAVLPGHMTPTVLRVFEVPGELALVARAINENTNRLNDDLRRSIFCPMSSHPLKRTPQAGDFFGKESRHFLGLRETTIAHPTGTISRLLYIES